MREILFRGKRKDNGEWIKGFYYQKPNPMSEDGLPIYHGISDFPPFGAEVIPETVGEFTGLTDKNGKKIFEGDIVKIKTINEDMIATIVYRKGFFIADSGRSIVNLGIGAFKKQQIKIIGNIHDNPELLKYESEEK